MTQDGYYGTTDTSLPRTPTLESTFAALGILETLTPPLDNDTYDHEYDIQIFLSGIANTTKGGYRNIEGGDETVLNTYKALYIAKILNINISTHMNTHASFLLKSQNVNGGFGSNPSTNSSPDIFNTYYALKALEITGNLTQVNQIKVRSFALSCRENVTYTFAGTSNSTDYSISSTYFAVKLYQDILENVTSTDLGGTANAIRTFIAGRLMSSGGFGDLASDTEPLISSTFYAVSICRDFAGDIPGGDKLTSDWLLSKQNFDGGFKEANSPVATSSMVATYYAVSAINKISPSLSVLNVDTPWTLAQIAGMVTAIVLIVGIVVLVIAVYYARKRNRI